VAAEAAILAVEEGVVRLAVVVEVLLVVVRAAARVRIVRVRRDRRMVGVRRMADRW
jgi:hypothetical protein